MDTTEQCAISSTAGSDGSDFDAPLSQVDCGEFVPPQAYVVGMV